MKQFVTLLIIMLPFVSKGQTRTLPDTNKIKISSTFWATPGSYYLDSIEIKTDKVYLDPNNIKEIKMFKGADSYIWSGSKGAVLITRKRKQPLCPLADIKIQLSSKVSSVYKYIINKKLIEDTLGVRIESTAIKKIEILRNSSNSVDHGFDNSTYILLTTKDSYKKNKRTK
jgi:hypothetical protein